jgi:hypothetical protein
MTDMVNGLASMNGTTLSLSHSLYQRRVKRRGACIAERKQLNTHRESINYGLLSLRWNGLNCQRWKSMLTIEMRPIRI